MPRGPRLDTEGALHHVMVRGIEKRRIFLTDEDRENLLARIGAIAPETGVKIYAWSLMPNHVHLLVQTGRLPLSAFMRRVLTGYAVSFNRRHRRAGHLFQNRYRSVLVEEEPYLTELVRYIHLNPLRGKQVPTLEALDDYRWSGHAVSAGKKDLSLAGDGRSPAPVQQEERASTGLVQGIRTGWDGSGEASGAGGRGIGPEHGRGDRGAWQGPGRGEMGVR